MARKRKGNNKRLNIFKSTKIYTLLFFAGAAIFFINTTIISYIFTAYPWTITAVMGKGRWWLTQSILVKIFYVGLISPILEELIFRKYIYGWFLKKDMNNAGIVVSSTLFSLYHILFGWSW
ncbi:MAG: CPBP family intramembrane glutamic endopeptidase, partial [archaeon]|nr:CPBP family intramembrane glutamic endopeptidase [archaeon]